MKTEANGVTAWSTNLFRIGLNKFAQGTATGWYVDLGAPSAAQFKNSLTTDIDYGHGFGADTVELAGGSHYNGHPVGQTIGHWLGVYGYASSGSTAYFSDPSTSDGHLLIRNADKRHRC